MYIFANLKAYLDFDETNILVHQLLLEKSFTESEHTIALFPSMLAFSEVEKALRGSELTVGAQHVAWDKKGAFTGSVSADYAAKAGATYTLVGHSERRHIFGETNVDTKKRFFAAMEAGLTPVLCIGETKEQADAGSREQVLKEQLSSVLAGESLEAPFLVAYEPVWAITGSGSGLACEPADAKAAHIMIQNELRTFTQNEVPVLYGGSVNAENVVSYTSLSEVAGVLVGSAGTKADRFLALLTS